jgi:hypothetical protein
MAVTGKPGVGAVLAEWMNRRRLNPTQLARLAQVSRSTVYVVLDSRSGSPSTMSHLAKGLATDPLDPASVDYDVERAAERALFEAIGVLRVVPSVSAEAGLEERIASLTGDPDVAVALATVTRDWHDLDEADRRVILAAVEAARRHRRRRTGETQT